MAYAFEKIMNQMGDNEKTNIFGGEPGQQGGGGSGQQQNFAAGTPKTSTDGDVSSGGGSGGAVQKSSFVAQSPQNAGAQRAYEAARSQPATTLSPMSQVSQKLSQAQTALQDEANKYVQSGKESQKYDIPEADIEKAAAGDKTASAGISKTLSQTLPNPIARFEPKTDTNLEEIETFKSTPGVAGYLRSQYGPGYTAGQAMFDTQRLQSSPQFYQELRGLEGRQQDLTKQAAALGAQDTGVEAQVRAAGTANLTAAQKAIRDSLTGKKTALEGANQGELTTYLEDLAKLKANPSEVAQKAVGASDASNRIAQVVKERPDLAKYLTPEVMATFGINPSQYVSFADPAALTADTFYDAAEAARFNQIMGLLGDGGAAKVAGAAPVQSSFNTDEYLKSVFGAAEGANTKADEVANAKVKAIQDKLAGLLGSQNNVPGVNTWAIPAFGSAASTLGYQGSYDPTLVDPNQFFQQDPITTNPFDYATDQDAQELNAAYEELMNPTRIQAGNRMGRPNYRFDNEGYKDAVMAALEARMRGTPSAPINSPMQPGPRYPETSPNEVFQEFGKIVPGIKKGIADAGRTVGRF